jgi:hypothetical protein
MLYQTHDKKAGTMTDIPFLYIDQILAVRGASPGIVQLSLGTRIEGKQESVPSIRIALPVAAAVTLVKAIGKAVDQIPQSRPGTSIGGETFEVDPSVTFSIAFMAVWRALIPLLRGIGEDVKSLVDEFERDVIRDAKNTDMQTRPHYDQARAIEAALAAIRQMLSNVRSELDKPKGQ